MGIFNYDSKFMQYANKFADLMILNALTAVCCLPIITIGASLTAMHHSVLKVYRNEEYYVAKMFFKSFKENFKQATAIWLIYLAIAGVFAVDMIIITGSGLEISKFLEYGLYVVTVMVALSLTWVFVLQSRYENKVKTTIKNAFVLGTAKPFRSILMIIVSAIPISILMFSIPVGMTVIMLFGFTLPGLLQAKLYSKVFDRLEGVDSKAPKATEIRDDGWTVELEEETVQLQDGVSGIGENTAVTEEAENEANM